MLADSISTVKGGVSMNAFNRVVFILFILLVVAALIVAAVVPFTVLERLIYTLQEAQNVLEARWPWSYLVFLAAVILLVLLGLILLWLEVRPRTKKTVTVRTVGGTQAEVSTASVQQSLQQRISQLNDVYKVKPTVAGKGGGVDVLLELETPPDIDIPSKVDEVSQVARDLIESKMGLRVSKIKVQLKHGPYGKTPSVAPVVTPVVTPEVVVPVEPAPEVKPAETETFGQQ
jgi:hypothetical protein